MSCSSMFYCLFIHHREDSESSIIDWDFDAQWFQKYALKYALWFLWLRQYKKAWYTDILTSI